MVITEAFFDESCTNPSDMVQCIAGYLIESDQAQAMTADWLALLNKYELPFFHMVECVQRSKNFKKYRTAGDTQTPDRIAREFFDIIMRYKPFGISVLFNPLNFGGFTDAAADRLTYDLYTEALIFAATAARKCVSRGGDATISFTFEQGHSSRSLAEKALRKFAKSNANDAIVRYSFEEKAASPLLQAADILAYQSTKNVKMWRQGKAMRKDFAALMEIPHFIAHLESTIFLGRPPKPGLKVFWGNPTINPKWDAILRKIYGRADEIAFNMLAAPLWNNPAGDEETLIKLIKVS